MTKISNRKTLTKDNIYIPKSFSPTTYNRFINQFIDKYNYGKNKKFRYTKNYINYSFSQQKSQQVKLTMDMIAEHLKGNKIYYYTCKRSSFIGMHVIDIDTKDEYSYKELLNCALFIINSFHPNTYYEFSKSGIHIYIFVDYSHYYPKCSNRNSLILSYSSLLAQYVNSQGFDCIVDGIKGTYSSDRTYENRGILCSLPCPKKNNDFINLVNSPIIPLSLLKNNINHINSLLCETGDHPSGSVLYNNLTILSTHLSRSEDQKDKIKGKKDNKNRNNKCLAKMKSNDAYERTLYSLLFLSQQLGRLAEYQEWNKYYEKMNLNTGEEREGRIKRFDSCIKKIEKTFNPGFTKSSPYKVGEYIEDLKNKITLNELREIGEKYNNGRRVTYEDLDTGAGYHWLCVLSNQKTNRELTVPIKGMIEMFKVLKEMGLIKRSCNFSKVRAIREALKKIGYIILLNSDYRISSLYKKDGIAQKWGIGENNPKYDEYQIFIDKDIVKKVISQAKQSRKSIAVC